MSSSKHPRIKGVAILEYVEVIKGRSHPLGHVQRLQYRNVSDHIPGIGNMVTQAAEAEKESGKCHLDYCASPKKPVARKQPVGGLSKSSIPYGTIITGIQDASCILDQKAIVMQLSDSCIPNH